MQEFNQGDEERRITPLTQGEGAEPVPGAPEASAIPPSSAFAELPASVSPPSPDIARGLWVWFGLIVALGAGGVVFGQGEMAMAATLAGAYAAAHAADLDSAFDRLHQVLMAVLILGGAVSFGGLAAWLATQTSQGTATWVGVGISAGAAVLCLLSGLRAFSNPLTMVIFRTDAPNHVLRLSARLVMMVLLFAFPAWVAFPGLIDMIRDRGQALLSPGDLYANLVGLIVLALGGVGFRVRRNGRQTLERLGFGPVRPVHWVVIAVGIGALYLLNFGTEAIERRWFPSFWQSDKDISELLASGLGVAGSILLGISAGAGEELAMRGALQPRLGVVMTALVFAALHVHYSWFGVATIFLLGMLLGWIRLRANTTVAVLVHAIYDMAVVLMTGKP
jgi:hypothetical protein